MIISKVIAMSNSTTINEYPTNENETNMIQSEFLKNTARYEIFLVYYDVNI